MSDRSYSEKRRTFLKTVGLTVGTVGGSGTIATATETDNRRPRSDTWTGVRLGPRRTGATEDQGPTPFPTIDLQMDLEGSMYDVEPVVADETVYLAVTTNNTPGEREGYIGAYESQTGTRQWKRSDLPALKTPSLNDGTLYFATKDPELSLSDEAGLYAIDANSGETKWHVSQPYHVTPAVADGRVYSASTEGAVALDAATGDIVWQTDNVGGIAAGAEGAVSYADDTVFLSDGTALNATTGSVKWETDDDGLLGNNVIGDERVYYIRINYITGDDDDVAIEARSIADGKLEWTYDSTDPNRWDGRPALADGQLFFLDSQDDSSVVKALDAETGSVVWTRTTNGELRSDPTIADGTVYVGGGYMPESDISESRALIYALDASTGRREWTYLLDSDGLETSPENPPAAGNPVVVNDRLYVTTYPGESTLNYRYINYSNFYAIHPSRSRPEKNCRLPAHPLDGDDQPLAPKAAINPLPGLDSEKLDAGDTLELDASCSRGQKLAYKWDTTDDGRYDRFGSSVYVTVPNSGSLTVRLKIIDTHDQTDTTKMTVSPL